MNDIINKFNNYINNFDLTNKDIILKKEHSLRVMALSEKYAKELNFNEHDIKLANIIGLLHDIGRFVQIRDHNTFEDKISIDHAAAGTDYLFKDNHIKDYYTNEEDYELIKFAIDNHNKMFIEETNNERYLKFAKLIRDIDKIDILKVYVIKDLIKYSNKELSKELVEEIKEHKIISYDSCNNENDEVLNTYSFVFDINYNICLEEYKKNYIKFHEYVNNPIFDEINIIVLNYINNRIKEDKLS